MASLDRAIFKTLVYADLFNWPLSVKEVWRGLISNQPVAQNKVALSLKKLLAGRKVRCKSGWYFLPGQEQAVRLRRRRQKNSQSKIRRARQAARLLGLIPFISLIAITGNVAVNNAAPEDDIDLMIIVQPNRLWLVRPMAILLLELFGWRRRPQDTQAKDKFCLNLWLDEAALTLPKNKQNLFIAHEIIQMKPLLDRQQTYSRFLQANQWGEKYLANGKWRVAVSSKTISRAPRAARWLNQWFYQLQLGYMRRRRTIESVGLHHAFFHLNDNSQKILKNYQGNLKKILNPKYNIPNTILITGCFDVLHSEHRRLLRAAKQLGGQLLVGVESDSRVRRLKGAGRPVNSIKIRLENLKKLKMADQVFSLPDKFDSEADFLKLLRRVLPDILAVSSSTPNLEVKRRLMKQIGGRVKVVLAHNPKVSTTQLLNRA